MDSTAALQIIVVDRDQQVRDLVADLLHRFGHSVCTLADCHSLGDPLLATVGLIILDVDDPDSHVCFSRIREQSAVPVLLLTSNAAALPPFPPQTAILSLAKPFTADELLNQLRHLLRRNEPESDTLLQWGPWQLETSSGELTHSSGFGLHLTAGEMALMELFLRQPKRPLHRDLLGEALNSNSEGARKVDVQVSRLRRRLGPHNGWLQTIRGLGYCFSDGS